MVGMNELLTGGFAGYAILVIVAVAIIELTEFIRGFAKRLGEIFGEELGVIIKKLRFLLTLNAKLRLQFAAIAALHNGGVC
jgi:hypothetical protein